VLLKITHFPYVTGIWVDEELNALGNRWQSRSLLQKRKQAANHKRTTSQLLRKPVIGSRSGTLAPKTPDSGGRIPSAGIREKDSKAPVTEARTGLNPEIEQLRALIEQLMTKFEADSKQSRIESVANAHATRVLSTHVQALTEKIEAQPTVGRRQRIGVEAKQVCRQRRCYENQNDSIMSTREGGGERL